MVRSQHDVASRIESTLSDCGLHETLITDFMAALGSDAVNWLNDTCQQLTAADLSARALMFLKFSGQTKGRLGYQLEHTSLDNRWSVGGLVRLVLLQKSLTSAAGQRETLIREIYRLSGNNEKYLLARGLSILDAEGALLDIALDMGRTNDENLLAALVQNNPYPARFYTEDQFNRLVLKAAFYNLDLGLIDKLDKRINPELIELCNDFIDEQDNAGRDFTNSIYIITGRY
ncbi:MAG: EboA domain-containing protein [Marinobacterium sp.]|nr:EboA domain-containing protein [Marinobacterium sp.]